MANEMLEIFDLEGNYLRTQDRKTYYKEIREEFSKDARISTQIKTIRMLLLNSAGRIYLQKRSRDKSENPGLYDKTIGGHVSAGESWELTLVRECAEELGFAASVLSDKDFRKASSTNLEIVGIVKKLVGPESYLSSRAKGDGSKFIQPQLTTYYLGYYDGPLRFVDGESCGIEVFSKEELREAIAKNRDAFTEDLVHMIEKFDSDIKALGER